MILSDNETKVDQLNNMAIAKTVVSIVKDSSEPVSIGIHGDWGVGKSSILAMIESELDSSYDDDGEFDWSGFENWSEPENAAKEESQEPPSAIVTTRFNSWQYQGFEDAKIALMSAIVLALQKRAKQYYTDHPVKNAVEKVKKTCKQIWGNIDKLSLAKKRRKTGRFYNDRISADSNNRYPCSSCKRYCH